MVATRSGSRAENGEEITRIGLFRVSSTQESLDAPIDRRSDYYRRQALARGGGSPDPAPSPLLTAPNVLTLSRIVLVPVFILLWYEAHRLASLSTATVFILAAVTDWFDGYLARRMQITSAFGAFLDPVADKVMVSTALVMLATAPPAPISTPAMAVPVIIMISREIAMSALREWAAASGGGAHKAVKVNSLGKWKTALQMIAVSALLLLRNSDHVLGDDPHIIEAIHACTTASFVMLWVAALLAAWSLANYMSNVWHFFRYPAALSVPEKKSS